MELLKLDEWNTLAAKWKAARDKAGGASGAVKSLGVGDAIDKVKEARKKGYVALKEASEKLVLICDKYSAAEKRHRPGAVAWLEANVQSAAEELIEAINYEVARGKQFRARMAKAVAAKIQCLPPLNDFEAASQGQKWKKDAGPLYAKFGKALMLWRKYAEAVDEYGKGFQLRIPGRPGPIEFMKHSLKLKRAVKDGKAIYVTMNQDYKSFAATVKSKGDFQGSLETGLAAVVVALKKVHAK